VIFPGGEVLKEVGKRCWHIMLAKPAFNDDLKRLQIWRTDPLTRAVHMYISYKNK